MWIKVRKPRAAKHRVHRKLTFPIGDQRRADREIIHEYGSIELLSQRILSPFLISFCEWCCKKGSLDGITH